MSLNWDATKCDDAALGGDAAREVTKTLVFATMAVDMGEITEENVEEFHGRVQAYEQLRGAFMTTYDGTQVIDRPLTLEDVRLRIGLKTNVTTLSAAKFGRKLKRMVTAS